MERKRKKKTARGLLNLGKWAAKLHLRGPKDLSTNHDDYIYGKKR